VAVGSKHWDSFIVFVGMLLEVVQAAFYDPRREEGRAVARQRGH